MDNITKILDLIKSEKTLINSINCGAIELHINKGEIKSSIRKDKNIHLDDNASKCYDITEL